MIMTRSDSLSASISADPPLHARFNVIMDKGFNYFAKFVNGFPIQTQIKLNLEGTIGYVCVNKI